MRYKSKKRFKRKKHILKRKWFWYLVLTAVFLAGVNYFLFFSAVFKIEKTDIVGVSDFSRAEVENIIAQRLKENFLFFIPKNNLFLANTQGMGGDILQSFPEIEKVEIKKDFPSRLFFGIKERQDKGIICQSADSCFLIDSQGVIFGEQLTLERALEREERKVVIMAEDLPSNLFKPGQPVLSPEKMSSVLFLYDKIENHLKIPVNKFILKQAERLDVETKQGWQMYFSLDSEMDLVLTKLEMLLESEITEEQRKNLEYIDLRFTKAYYK